MKMRLETSRTYDFKKKSRLNITGGLNFRLSWRFCMSLIHHIYSGSASMARNSPEVRLYNGAQAVSSIAEMLHVPARRDEKNSSIHGTYGHDISLGPGYIYISNNPGSFNPYNGNVQYTATKTEISWVVGIWNPLWHLWPAKRSCKSGNVVSYTILYRSLIPCMHYVPFFWVICVIWNCTWIALYRLLQ